MSDVINLSKKRNHRWKTDPRFIEGFDYEKPEYADTPDNLRWALPIHESISNPRVVAESKRRQEKIRAELKLGARNNLRKKLKLSVLT